MTRKIQFIAFAIIASGIVLMQACLKDKEPVTSFDCANTDLTYTNTIKSIMDNHCVSCHVSGGTASILILDNYNNVKANVEKIITRMNSASSPMPTSGLLDQATRDKVSCWKEKNTPQ